MAEMVNKIDQIQNEDIRGYRLASILDSTLPTYAPRSRPRPGGLDEELHHLFCEQFTNGEQVPNNVKYIEEISTNGVVYGTEGSNSTKNSSVIFRLSADAGGTCHAGVVSSIFIYTFRTPMGGTIEEFFLVVEQLCPLLHDIASFYSRYGLYGGFLCHAGGRTRRLIHVSNIASHFALTPLTGADFGEEAIGNLIHVLPLDRVSSMRISWYICD